ncbi:MAG: glycosyltransferase family 9 protein [Verrucomicrobia bacterium]|nr:glycosyltransferase family 9 protein [Verrucomicrobiota bacterium]
MPVVQALRRRFPQWRIGLITHPQLRELYAPEIADDDLLLVSPDDMRLAWRYPWRVRPWLRLVRNLHPEAILLSYDQSTVAHLLGRFSSARLRVGARFGMPFRRAGLTHPVEWRQGWSFAQWHWEMARTLIAGLGQGEIPAQPPAPDLTHLTRGTVRVPGRVVIHPGAKTEMNRWPAERHAELAARLVGHGAEVIWVKVTEAAVPVAAGVQTMATGTVGDLVRLLASASLFVGNNSGPLHLANAVGTPVVAVTGRAPSEWDPAWHREHVRVLRQPDLPCQPCERFDYLPRTCANTTEPLACLRRCGVDSVEAVCLEMLSPRAAQPHPLS